MSEENEEVVATVKLGDVVLYKPTEEELHRMNRRYNLSAVPGNNIVPGQQFPMMVVRVWSDYSVNGKVIFDGEYPDMWVTSAHMGTCDGEYQVA